MSSAVAVVAAILLALPLFALAAAGLGGAWLSLLGVLGAIPAIDAAVALVNRGVTRGFGATLLPALELRDGVPAHLRTLVAVPTLLTTREAIEEQIERLEIHHLASPEGDLHFALLSDWVDAATEHAGGRRGSPRRCSGGHRAAQPALRRRRPAATASCCSIAGESGTKAKDGGSAGSASAASCTS